MREEAGSITRSTGLDTPGTPPIGWSSFASLRLCVPYWGCRGGRHLDEAQSAVGERFSPRPPVSRVCKCQCRAGGGRQHRVVHHLRQGDARRMVTPPSPPTGGTPAATMEGPVGSGSEGQERNRAAGGWCRCWVFIVILIAIDRVPVGRSKAMTMTRAMTTRIDNFSPGLDTAGSGAGGAGRSGRVSVLAHEWV